MSNYIKEFDANTREYNRLALAAALLTMKNPNGYHYYVDVTYFDFGQGWLWTTILCDRGNGDIYQALYPRDQEAIITGDIEAAVDTILQDKHCLDRMKEDRFAEKNHAAVAGLVDMYA